MPKSAKQMVRMQRAIRCLVNAERRKRGRKTLRFNLPLQKASDWQANDMLTYQYFDHTRPDGPTFSERVLRFGYADGADGYLIGENLAWSSASGASPRKIVSLWMHSPPHRHNILTHAFRDQAVSALWSNGGVGGAYASSNGPFVIYVNQFGRRY